MKTTLPNVKVPELAAYAAQTSILPFGKIGLGIKLLTRFLQVLLAAVTIIIYAPYLTPTYNDLLFKDGGATEISIILSLAVASVSVLAAVAFMIPKVSAFRFYLIDGVVALLWAGLFAIWLLRDSKALPLLPQDGVHFDEGKLNNAKNLSAAQGVFWLLTSLGGLLLSLKSKKRVDSMDFKCQGV